MASFLQTSTTTQTTVILTQCHESKPFLFKYNIINLIKLTLIKSTVIRTLIYIKVHCCISIEHSINLNPCPEFLKFNSNSSCIVIYRRHFLLYSCCQYNYCHHILTIIDNKYASCFESNKGEGNSVFDCFRKNDFSFSIATIWIK